MTTQKLAELNRVFGIWHYNHYLRVTYVAAGWLVVWDHRGHPPTRYDCQMDDHLEACQLAENKLRELLEL